jgi:hypothetical protein
MGNELAAVKLTEIAWLLPSQDRDSIYECLSHARKEVEDISERVRERVLCGAGLVDKDVRCHGSLLSIALPRITAAQPRDVTAWPTSTQEVGRIMPVFLPHSPRLSASVIRAFQTSS